MPSRRSPPSEVETFTPELIDCIRLEYSSSVSGPREFPPDFGVVCAEPSSDIGTGVPPGVPRGVVRGLLSAEITWPGDGIPIPEVPAFFSNIC